MAIRRFSTAEPGVKSNRFWDQDTQQGAMVPIGSFTANGTQQSAIFTNIPQIYQHLYIVTNLRSQNGSAQDSYQIQVNNTVDIYGDTWMRTDGTSATSHRDVSPYYGTPIGNCPSSTATAGVLNSGTAHVFNYASSTSFKTILSRSANDRNGAGDTSLVAAVIRTTSPITVLHVFTSGSNMFPGSNVSLYGIKAGA